MSARAADGWMAARPKTLTAAAVPVIIGCALAHKDVRWRETLLLSVLVTAGAVAIFHFGLGLPYPLFWWDR